MTTVDHLAARTMASRIHAFDWAATALGGLDCWPPAQRQALTTCLAARMPMALWLGPELMLCYNDAWRAALGSPSADDLGRPGAEALAGLWEIIGPTIREVFDSGQATTLPVTLASAAEARHISTLVVTPVHDSQGAVLAITTALVEHPALRQRRTLPSRAATVQGRDARVDSSFERMAEAAPAAIYVYDLQTRSSGYANRQLADTLGYTAGEVRALGTQLLAALMHPDDWAAMPEHLGRLRDLPEGRAIERDYRMRRRDGTWCWLTSREAVFARGPDGAPTEVLGCALDITGRKLEEERLQRQQRWTERVAEALHRSEARYRSLVEASAQVVWRAGPDGELIARRARWSAMTGIPIADLPDEPLDLVHPDDRERGSHAWWQAMRDMAALCFEQRVRGADGRYRTWQVRAVPVPESDGRVREWVGTDTDITDRVEAEQALRESEARFRTLFEQAAVGVAQIDTPTGRFLRVNRRYADIVGYTVEEMVALTFQTITHPDDLEADLASMRRLTAGEIREFAMEKRYRRKDGELIWVRLSVSPMWAPGEPPDYHIAIVEDITERKRAEEQLAYANSRFRLAEEAAQGFSYEWNVETGVVNRSESITRVLGYRREEIPATWSGWAELIHPDDRTVPSQDAAASLVQQDDQILSSEYRVRHRDGHYVWVLERALSVRDAKGLLRRVIGQTVDITERKRFEAERERLYAQERRAREQAEEASRLKDEFLATVSHELRTPLTAFLGYAQMLQSRKRDEAYIARTVERMVRSAKAQAELIEDLLDISRIVSGKLRIDPAPVDLHAVVLAALDTVRPAAEARGLAVDVSLDPGVGDLVGDAQRLQQVVWNLLTNAVKFTPPGGRVSIALARRGGDAELTVRDTGQGIRPDFVPYVFDRFRQGDGSTSRTHGGLGIGLAIVRHLVELHGGSVAASSPGEGQGATFTVRLPLASAALRGASAPRAGADPGGAGKAARLDGLRVLVVDDQREILDLLEEVLAAAGAEVRACERAAAALDVLRAWQPHVLVSDIAMPGKDGYWLIQQVRALAPEDGGATPAVALTAYVRMEDRLTTLAAGFERYVPKPVDPAELCSVVAELAQPFDGQERERAG